MMIIEDDNKLAPIVQMLRTLILIQSSGKSVKPRSPQTSILQAAIRPFFIATSIDHT